MSSALRRSTALSAATVSDGKKKASRGESESGGEWGMERGGEGGSGGLGEEANLRSSLFVFRSKIVKALTRLSISVSVFPKLIINVKCCGIGNSAVTPN